MCESKQFLQLKVYSTNLGLLFLQTRHVLRNAEISWIDKYNRPAYNSIQSLFVHNRADARHL